MSAGDRVATDDAVAVRHLRAMASSITLALTHPVKDAEAQLDRAEATLREVERTCSRFDDKSALSAVNAHPDSWHDAPVPLAGAVLAAHRAYQATEGLFDPRVIDTLTRWGYDRTLPFDDPDLDLGGVSVSPAAPPPATEWRPQVVEGQLGWRVHLGGTPIDLGGIGKGLAVRWAAEELAATGRGVLVDAGGDCVVKGVAPHGGAWRIGVEDPHDGPSPLLVLEVSDAACATSSIRRRRWRVAGEQVHHLVDPRTRRPGGHGLAAVTVVTSDPAWAEVWSKALFLSGADQIRNRAEEQELAALWIDAKGAIGTSSAMDPLITWRRDA